jgi:hypothetical protein
METTAEERAKWLEADTDNERKGYTSYRAPLLRDLNRVLRENANLRARAEKAEAELATLKSPPSDVFRAGDKVQKRSGSSWHGTVVGVYSSSLTHEGYVVESDLEPGSCQLYPAAALEPWNPLS